MPPVRKLSEKIQLEIKPKLQNQISYLCKEISRVEWSGVLFYTTEGTFGEPGFKMVGEELFLMDVGTSGYTEYEYGKDLVDFLMKNKPLLKMYKGHIHSHNSMSVFFSGTDESELFGNSVNHNLYLSLIVNNYNDMVARVAYRGFIKSVTMEMKNEKGNPLTIQTEENAEFILYNECDISLPDMKTVKTRIEDIKHLKAQQKTGGSSKRDIFRQNFEQEEMQGSRVEKGLYEFLTTLLNGPSDTFETMVSTMSRLGRKLISQDGSDPALAKRIRKSVVPLYTESFNDPDMKDFVETMKQCKQVANNYKYGYPTAFNFVTSVLDEIIENHKKKKHGKSPGERTWH